MLFIILFILAVGLFLYTILGGADFGAGILEIFMGKKSEHSITEAIAPVWEANHVWLILVVVVVFNGFPRVYSTLSQSLHIPLMLVLVGIIFRGTAFTFRHYDVVDDKAHRYYSWCFRISSLLTPFFLGICLGAMILGRMSTDLSLGFYELFVAPWWNVFCLALGLFSCCFFAYLAAVFLLGEIKNESLQAHYRRVALRAQWICGLAGLLVFAAAEYDGLALAKQFTASPYSLAALAIAGLMIPLMKKAIEKGKRIQMRLLAGAQTACILLAWAIVQYPVFIYLREGTHLTIHNTQAPAITLYYMVIALIVGCLLIFPGIFILFHVFKREADAA